MFIDEDQDSVDRETMEDVCKPVVSYEITDEEETRTIAV